MMLATLQLFTVISRLIETPDFSCYLFLVEVLRQFTAETCRLPLSAKGWELIPNHPI